MFKYQPANNSGNFINAEHIEITWAIINLTHCSFQVQLFNPMLAVEDMSLNGKG